eukprot:m.405572 g.405572  ORF g.405572 m.405572 type:complete len:207 (+) comp21207_c0_seq24:1419-2039(+)
MKQCFVQTPLLLVRSSMMALVKITTMVEDAVPLFPIPLRCALVFRGALVARSLGAMFPQHCHSVHMNMPVAMMSSAQLSKTIDVASLSEGELKNLKDMARFAVEETGYQKIQASKPQTLAYGLTDSPVGLCAWIVEKFRAWSDCDGDVLSVFTMDELLNNVMIYWISNCIASSVRLYYEVRSEGTRPSNLPTSDAVNAFLSFRINR